jgi:hypothetical protein
MKTLLLLLAMLGVPSFAGDALAREGSMLTPAPVRVDPVLPEPSTGWWVEDGLYARVHAAPEHRVLARELADHAARAVPRLAYELGVSSGATIDVYLAPTARDFAHVQPGPSPEWADGTAWPAQGRIFLRAPGTRGGATTPLATVLEHELVHVLLGRAFGEAGSRPGAHAPRWLQEGLARLYAGEYGPEAAATLRGAGELPTLASITRHFPADAPGAQVAYAASADFLSHVRATHGADALSRLVARMVAGDDAATALEAVTGQPFSELERTWRGGWAIPVLGGRVQDVLLGVGAVAAFGGMALAVRRRRARNAARLARWERQEALADALARAVALRGAQPN